ncbi:hypothetical protein [Streptomyces kurssanovii]|uniref:Uncharacterized protein n=1 Tax=Streptomyces kurssanovii TaxID=67312 RepID=A0ABV3HW59_9ACTN
MSAERGTRSERYFGAVRFEPDSSASFERMPATLISDAGENRQAWYMDVTDLAPRGSLKDTPSGPGGEQG